MSLVKLGRRAEAGQTIGATLARNPEDALTHANQGWTLLESGDPKQAMLHFREALRLEPNQEWARAGIVEALKARNIIYRVCLNYFLFMSKLSPQTQWVIVVGLFLLQRVAGSLADKNPTLAPFIQPFLILYLVFALLTWLGSPLFDLLLCLDKFGRLVLSTDQKQRALAVAGVLAAALATFGASVLLQDILLSWAALNLALLAIPTSAIHVCPEGRPRWTMLGATVCLAVLGALPLGVDVLIRLNLITVGVARGALGLTSNVYVFGIIGSQFLANALANVTVRR
jgi:tetratricopeptide (TPR) repeat protein